MSICSECKSRMKPLDPGVPIFIRLGEYAKPTCYYCPEYDHSQALSETPKTVFRPRPVDAEIDRLKNEVNYLMNKVSELQAKKKKADSYEPF